MTLIHSVNALTWAEYLSKVGERALRPSNELWIDRSTMAIDAALSGLGVVLESEFQAAEELRDGRLVAPFGDEHFNIETTTYYVVRSRSRKNDNHANAFEAWLRARIEVEYQKKSLT